MTNILDEAKLRLQRDFPSPSDERDYLESLMNRSEADRLPLLRWVFEESLAYWDTRAWAGIILLQENEAETWQTIKKLVASANPDDNGTALTIFERTGDPRGVELAKDWLNDRVHPATQIEAINFLINIYPEQIWPRLRVLMHHKNPIIRNTAKRLANEITSSSD